MNASRLEPEHDLWSLALDLYDKHVKFFRLAMACRSAGWRERALRFLRMSRETRDQFERVLYAAEAER